MIAIGNQTIAHIIPKDAITKGTILHVSDPKWHDPEWAQSLKRV